MNKNALCCEGITPIYPKNGDTVELTDELVLQFVNGYTVGSSVKYAFRGDCYAPKALKLIWQGRSEKGFKVSIGCEADLSDACTYYADSTEIEIHTHFLKKTVYWQVTPVCDCAPQKNPIFTFNLARFTETVYIEGVSNTRDIGGFLGLNGKTIGRGLVYRGSCLDGITDAGKAFCRDVLRLKAVLDLRNDGEGSADEELSPLGVGVKHLHVGGCMYTGNNWSGVAHVGKEGVDIPEGMRKVVAELSAFEDKENLPIYTHCVLGRDRTGTLIVMLLALCGVKREDILRDYELSFFSKTGCGENTPVEAIISYVQKVFEYLDTYPGQTLCDKTVSYLKQAGMTDLQIEKIRSNLLV